MPRDRRVVVSGGKGRAPRDRTRTGAPVVGGRRAVTEAIRAGTVREILIVPSSKTTPGMRDLLDAAGEAGVTVTPSQRETLDALAEDHQGVVARLEGLPGAPSAR